MTSTPIRRENLGWRDDATCAVGLYPFHLWFSKQKSERDLAKAICLGCPVIDQCTAYAVESPVGHGIVAGMNPNQLAELKRTLRRATAA